VRARARACVCKTIRILKNIKIKKNNTYIFFMQYFIKRLLTELWSSKQHIQYGMANA